MITLKTFSHFLKPVLSKFHNFKHSRAFCSPSNNFKDIIKSNEVQKYFDHISEEGLDDQMISKDIQFQLNQLIQQRKETINNIQSLEDLEKSSKGEDEFLKMLNEERKEFESKLSDIEFKLLDALSPEPPSANAVIVEINAGVGGKEAMLFACELQDMYLNYIDYKKWVITHQDCELEDAGTGLRHCTLFIEGRDILNHLCHESGIHRVQRVPTTERHGRIHTSTVAVAVFPRPSEIEVNLQEKDLHIETMRASGAGGQHVNKTESAVRITHLPTGVVTECRTDRSQIKNREVARQKLVAKLFEIQQKEQTASMQKSRKSQVGTSARSDKIRTYNYPQDRITDHRIPKTMYNMAGFLEGTEMLDSLINELILFSERERFNLFVMSLNDKFISAS